MRMLLSYLKRHKKYICSFTGCALIFLFFFRMYDIEMKAVLYPAYLSAVLVFLLFLISFTKYVRKEKELERIKNMSSELIESLPKSNYLYEDSYKEIIGMLIAENRKLQDMDHEKFQEMTDYYTLWAHQIKTPISAMKLMLHDEDSDLSRKLRIELNHIEKYVDMVMGYLRLDSTSTDYVFKRYSADEMITDVIKEYRSEFILRKIRLDYERGDSMILTDRKWFSFVLGQILSNSLKYTPENGTISITVSDGKITVRDSGIGIAYEDQKRVFEKGFTGRNGRENSKSSGLGLYLVKSICDRLNIRVSLTSEPGEYTEVVLDTKVEERSFE